MGFMDELKSMASELKKCSRDEALGILADIYYEEFKNYIKDGIKLGYIRNSLSLENFYKDIYCYGKRAEPYADKYITDDIIQRGDFYMYEGDAEKLKKILLEKGRAEKLEHFSVDYGRLMCADDEGRTCYSFCMYLDWDRD